MSSPQAARDENVKCVSPTHTPQKDVTQRPREQEALSSYCGPEERDANKEKRKRKKEVEERKKEKNRRMRRERERDAYYKTA